MKAFKRGEKGFTLVELLIVVAILGVLAAVVIPNIVGLLGRGGKQAYNTDLKTIQTAASAFYGDIHAGVGTDGWGSGTLGHWHPTESGNAGNISVKSDTGSAEKHNGNLRLLVNGNVTQTTQGTVPAGIADAAIWMGLLVNPATSGQGGDAGTVHPQVGEEDLYLNEFPKSSSMVHNGNPVSPGGSYIWVVGERGIVYGVYQAPADAGDNAGYWYAGFSGTYP